MKAKRTVFIMLTALLLFIALTTLVVTENAPVQAFNDALYAPIAERITPVFTTISTVIGSLTHWYSYAPIILLLLIIPRTRMKIGLPIAITVGISAILGPIILKNIFAIERPNVNQLITPGGFGYPSGHSMNAVVFFGMCTLMVLRYASRKWLRIAFSIFAVLSILAVGLSRVYLGVHVVTDAIGGYLAGVVVLCAAILIEGRLEHRKTEVTSDEKSE